jgi:xylan 1,4-beta-xylosidase
LHPGAGVHGRDDFDLAELHPSWISLRRRPPELCTTKERAGWLTLRAGDGTLDDLDATFLGRRQQHPSCRARTRIDAAGGRGGLAVRLDERHHYELEVTTDRVEARARIGPLSVVVAATEAPDGPLVLRIEAVPTPPGDPRDGPDEISIGVEEADGTFTVLATLDGRYLSTEVAGGFTGRVIGMYASAGTVRFDWFAYVAGGS